MFSNKYSAPILITILALIVLFGVNHYFITPKKTVVINMNNTVNQLEQDYKSVQTQITSIKTERNEITSAIFDLEKKIPPSRDLTDLLLKMEQLETIAEARITSVAFNNYDTSVTDSALGEHEQQTPEAEEEQEQKDEENAEKEQVQEEEKKEDAADSEELPVSTISKDSLPKELQLITLNIDISAKDEEKLTLYLQEIESLERLVKVDRIETTIPGEEDRIINETNDFVKTVLQITTFFYDEG